MIQSDELRPAACYYLITHGARYDGRNVLDRPEAAQQSYRFLTYFDKAGLKQWTAACEFRRRARDLDDFRILQELIRGCDGNAAKPIVVIADVRRLLRLLPEDKMLDAIKRLAAPKDLVHDTFFGSPLSSLSDDQLEVVVTLAQRRNVELKLQNIVSKPRKKSDSDQTEEAREWSAMIRRENAEQVARTLAALRDELVQAHPNKTPTFAEIASVANSRGLRTPRGAQWASGLVSRALRRL